MKRYLALLLLFVLAAGCAKKQIIIEDPVRPVAIKIGEQTDYKTWPFTEIELELDTIYFDFDKHNLKQTMRANLSENAEIISRLPIDEIVIEGHCDSRGSIEYNIALGQKRADMVRGHYRAVGVHVAIETISYGEEKPASNFHWQNRRAVTIIK